MEETLLELPNARVTNARAEFYAVTYPLAQISAVGKRTISASGAGPAILLTGGVIGFLISYAIGNNGDPGAALAIALVLGIVPMILGFYVLARSKAEYAVTIYTSGGQSDGYRSAKAEDVDRVHVAITEALVRWHLR